MRKTVHKLEKVMKPIYKRILLKLSGEGLMGDKNFGMSAEVTSVWPGRLKKYMTTACRFVWLSAAAIFSAVQKKPSTA